MRTGQAMRKAEAGRLVVSGSSRAVRHALRLSAVALGVGLLMASGAARAGDDDEDDKTFEEKVIEGVMRGLGGTNMERHRLSRAVAAGGAAQARPAAAGLRIGRRQGA